jgi:hypothetical protein
MFTELHLNGRIFVFCGKMAEGWLNRLNARLARPGETDATNKPLLSKTK